MRRPAQPQPQNPVRNINVADTSGHDIHIWGRNGRSDNLRDDAWKDDTIGSCPHRTSQLDDLHPRLPRNMSNEGNPYFLHSPLYARLRGSDKRRDNESFW